MPSQSMKIPNNENLVFLIVPGLPSAAAWAMPAVARMKKSSLLFAAALAAALTLVIWLLGSWSIFYGAEDLTLKWRYELRNQLQSPKPNPHLVLVGIDDDSQERLKTAWPFPRDWHAQILTLLAEEKPAVVTWDILFTDPKSDAPEKDAAFVEAAKLFPHMITGANSDNDPHRTNPPLEKIGPTQPFTKVNGDLSTLPAAASARLPFQSAEAGAPSLLQNCLFGFVDCEPDSSGVRRSVPMIVLYQGKLFASLSLRTVLEYYGATNDDVTINLGKDIVIARPKQEPIRIPINQHGDLIVNFRRSLEDFTCINYGGLLYCLLGKAHPEEAKAQNPDFEKDLEHNKTALNGIKNNIVVFGFTGVGFDNGATPLQKNTPLVNVQLNAMANILEQDFIHQAPTWLWICILFPILFLLTVILLGVHIRLIIPIGFLSLIGYFVLSYALFQFQHLLIPTTLPMAGLLVVTLLSTTKLYFGEDKQKRQIKAAMAAYIPEKVMQRVLEHPDNLRLGGTNRELSILFCDIRGFTKYCDNRAPEDVVGVLNEYMEVMSNVIFKYEGTIDKYIGDCIMAFWNAPEDQPDHAQRAVCCAMEMRYALANYKTQRAGIDSEIFECGIGIHTGPALVGNIGSSRRLSYTAIGASVNMAARLESLTKRFTSRIIISEATRAQITTEQFTLTDLGDVLVPGFAQKIRLYSVEALQDISAALLVGKKVAHESNVSVAEVQQPLWSPAPLPADAEVDAEGKG